MRHLAHCWPTGIASRVAIAELEQLPNNRKEHVEEILAELRERMMRYEVGEPPAPLTAESKAEAERLRRGILGGQAG